MSQPVFSRRSQATLILFVALAGLSVAALMRRCDAPATADRTEPVSTPALEGPGRYLPLDEVRTTLPPATAPTAQPMSTPSKPKRNIVVSDIFGVRVKGAEIRVVRTDGFSGRKLITGEDGRVEIPDDLWEDSILHCC